MFLGCSICSQQISKQLSRQSNLQPLKPLTIMYKGAEASDGIVRGLQTTYRDLGIICYIQYWDLQALGCTRRLADLKAPGMCSNN